jgi:acetolactate synthase-1/2/3 large subunit
VKNPPETPSIPSRIPTCQAAHPGTAICPAQIANPNKIVIDIDGDGSFNHTLADLQTIYRYKLPIKMFIMNDGQMSMVRAWEKLFYNENYIATDCSSNPNYSMLANSYGISSIDLNKKSDLADIVDYVIKYVIIYNCWQSRCFGFSFCFKFS